jgi:hypothetical protein
LFRYYHLTDGAQAPLVRIDDMSDKKNKKQEEVSVYVTNKCLTSKKGLLDVGSEITAEHLPNGEESMKELEKAGLIKKEKKEVK